jgi:hypothetical protein
MVLPLVYSKRKPLSMAGMQRVHVSCLTWMSVLVFRGAAAAQAV